MNLLSVEGISKAYGEHVIFEPLSFGISKGQKIALIAKNGSGKTTILKIIAGQETPDAGLVNFRKGIQVSFLQQEPILDPKKTVEEIILASGNKTLEVIATYEKALLNPEDEEKYQEAFDAMEQHGAWDFETEYKQLLSKLKLDDLTLKVGSLSGGQKKRLALCSALLQKPDLLILDEPTNHLDLEMIEWMEAYFIKEKITLLMVTHDRYFLERVCNEIIELDEGNLYTYKGSYSYYLEKRAARIEQNETEAHKTKRHFSKELEWMRKQPKARTTKSKSRIDDFNAIKEKAQQLRNDQEVELEINMERLGSKMIEMHKVSKAFEDKVILKAFDYNFQRNDRIGIIGNNGTGKSTFLKLLTNQQQPDAGKIVRGETLKFGYYTQDGIAVKPGQKVIEVIQEYGEYIPLKKGRKISAQQLLERFLFDRKKQYDFVEKLSGGERKRLYLCSILIQNPNFLILDE
ncbi:ATP-binding cassette domain-containing protein, partial [Flavobacteriaceae bacterium]|nr:ATP-binding cassette domain-containing protein [Flavobacteriaceae bacterium]